MIRKSHGVALAALALAASGAFAQSSVKVYGLLDASFGSIKPSVPEGTSQATPTVDSGMMTTSFIGFSGVEDLGGGLKAEFALESFLGVDNGSNVPNNAGNFWGRASWVGLSGSFGRVAIGQYDNPLFTFGYTYNPFGSSMAFSPTMRHYNYIGQTDSGAKVFGVGFDTGWVNSLTYETPNLSGFTGVVQYAFKESTANDDGNSFALGGFYNAGPLSLGAVFVSADTGSPADAWVHDETVWALGFSYDFGMAKAFFQYSNVKNKDYLVVGEDTKNNIFQLGVSVPVSSAGTVMASFGQSKVKDDVSDIKDTVLSIAYDHALSKRTDVYLVYMYNKKSDSTDLIDWKTGNSFAVGIRHNF